nr:unnamed protein product [Callosobruchus chinensis]
MILSITVIFVAVWRNEQILAAHKPSILHWKVFFVFQATVGGYFPQMCFTYVTLITSLLVEIIIQLCLLEKTLESVEDNEGIKQCVEWHLQILVFVEKVQRFCGVGISGVLLCGYINICTTLSLLTQVQYVQMIFLLPYIFEIMMILYSHCWCGSEVVYQSEKISSAIYCSQWTNADDSHKKKICIYIMLTQKPLQIYLGGGVTTASLPVFVTVMNF